MRHQAQRLSAFAHAHRAQPTHSEEVLWRALRASQLGVRFKRQVPLLGCFIADFYCPSARLVVEVDGGCHSQRRSADERRDRKLRRAGYRVLRLDAALVTYHLPVALERIREALQR